MSKSKKIINRKYNKNTKKSKKNRTKKSRKHRAKKMMGGAEIVGQCSICYEEMLDNEKLITCLNTIGPQHTYHQKCILGWCARSNTIVACRCPTCESFFGYVYIDIDELYTYITSRIPSTGVTYNNLVNLLAPFVGTDRLETECENYIMVFVNNNGNYSFNGFIFLNKNEKGPIKDNNRISGITNNFNPNNIYLRFSYDAEMEFLLLRLYIEVDENNNGEVVQQETIKTNT